MASVTKTRQTSGLSPRTVRDGGEVGLFSPPTRRSGDSRLYSEGGD
jgi:DNA-binding transcriptional MerR regulator